MALRLAVAAIGTSGKQGQWSYVDLEAPSVRADNVQVSLENFEKGLREYVEREIGAALAAADAARERMAELLAEQDSQNWLDKEEWGFQLSASAERVTASYIEKITVVASDVAGIASQVVQLQAELDNLDANVTFRTVAAVSLPAGALAAYEAAAQVSDGVYTTRAAMMIAAYSNAGGTYSTFEAEADLFVLTRRVNGIRVSPFVSNASGIFIQGDLIVDGSITAPKLNIGTLSAIAGNVGTLTAGIIRSADGKVVLDLNAGTFRISS